ncbi:MAG: 50S ribosomal protein L10 [Pirellulales bacterium]
MSKYVKDLVTKDLRNRLAGVDNALLVNVVGLSANTNSKLRAELRAKDIHLLVIKNSLARRATEGTPLASAFLGLEGSSAIVWGATDIVALAKEVTKAAANKEYAPLETRGGVLDGVPLSQSEVAGVSKWPTREEQLSILLGQILSPGANLVSQLTSVAGALASQIESRGESEESSEPAESTESTEGAESSEGK